MYGAFIFLIILILQTDGFTLDNVHCNYIFRQKCHTDINNYNVVQYNPSIINYCTIEDVPNEIDFTVIWDKSYGYILKVEFTPPKRECRYGIALLVNPSIKDEKECREYKFEKAKDIDSTVHTIEKTLCILINNQLMKYNDNSTVSLCKDIEQWYRHIFTGCYALRFRVDKQNYIIRGHKLLNTTYHPKQVMEPQFICKYNIYSNTERHELTNFTLNTSLPSDTGSLLKVKLISEYNTSLENSCVWYGEPPIYTRTIDLMEKSSKDLNCTIKWMQTIHGEYMKTVQCNFQVQTKQMTDYCFVFRVVDDRCHKNTFWMPSNVNEIIPCIWIKRCVKTFENSAHIESTNIIKSDKLLNTSSYLLLPIIAVVLIVSTIVGTLCFLHYLRIRKEEINLYVNPRHDDFMNPVCLKPADFSMIDHNDSEKRIHQDNFTCDDIVLLYTKNSASFMSLMKDFREMLAKICSCYVHDWHDGVEWNDVAKVGAVLWFTELLNCGCRVVWIDTPATRFVVTSNSKNDLNLNKLNKYYEIGDFRDVAFPVVLELAKRNTKNVVHQYRRHFIVRFEGLESTINMHDPFLDLSPHARYRMPQHLVQLCSDISLIKPMISKCEMKAEEDLLQQRLRFMIMKMETMM